MRLYRWLLRLCPASLRREYGGAMEETFARRLSDSRGAGVWQRGRVWRRELAGLLALAASERWGAAGRARRRRHSTASGKKAGRMDVIAREIRHAARRLVRSPAFTLAAVLTLALAIGANASIFAVVERVVLNPLPYPDSDRLIALDYGIPARNLPSGLPVMSWQLYYQFADQARTLDSVAVYNTAQVTLTGGGDPERIQAARATPSLPTVLRVPPALGRWFTDQESVPGAAPVVVLSHGLWVRRFGREPSVLGRSVTIEGVPTTVVGVMPAAFAFPNSTPPIDVWMAAPSTRATASFLFTVAGVARMREGVTIANARAELTGHIAALARVSPNQRGIVSTALPLQDSIVGRVAGALWILLASVALVLLVACANVANLFLVRSEARQREVAVRRALGAGRRGIAGYFLAESTLLAIAGGAAGLALAWGAVQLLVAWGPTNLPRLNEVRLDGIVLAFTLALSLLTAVMFGAIPLLRVAPLAVSLHENGRGNTASRGRYRARHVLMGGQIALALVLLVSSGLMVRSFQKLRALDPGFDPTSALTFSIGLPSGEYATRRQAVAAHHAFLDRLSSIPGVTAVSASTCLPLAGGCFGNGLIVEGETFEPFTVRPFVFFRGVSGGYLETMGIRVLRGRGVDRGDVDRKELNIVANRAFADAYFPNADPIGRRVRSSTPPNSSLPAPDWLTIVGVVSNTPTIALAEPTPVAQLYMPMSIAGGPDIPAQALIGPDVATMSFVVRSSTPSADLVTTVTNAVRQVDANLALAQVGTLQGMLDRASEQMAFTMVLIAIAASVALLLGVIGIYGVMSYIVSQRTGEIGVRLALGAEPGSVAGMIVRQGGLVALAGITVGLGAAWAGTRVIASLLYGVSPRDPGVFAATTLTLLAVALLACWLPARRAARLSPVEALRTE
jgi:putative ABC transport system permease protein